MNTSVSNGKTHRASVVVCLFLLYGHPLHAFSSIANLNRNKERIDVSLFSSQQPYDFLDDENNSGSNNGEQRQKKFRMVQQFNGDYKTVPYYEGDRSARNPAAEAEMRLIEASRRNPPLTSPARALMSKQWDWKRPSSDQPRPRFRQVRTFSGDVKTVPFNEDPYFQDQVTNSEFGRVDGTNYVPDLAPPSRRRERFTPPPPRSDFRPTPPSPPAGRTISDDRMPPSRSRETERFEPKNVGNEFRREMRKYKRGDFELYTGEDTIYDSDDRKDPLKKLAKETEKFLRQVTGFGGGYKMVSRENKQRDMEYRRNPAADYEFDSVGAYNTPPPVRSYEVQQPLRPPPSSYEETGRPSYSASRSVQSFSGENKRRRPKPYAVLGQPRYRMERQFNGDYRQVPVYGDDSDDDSYSNPSARSEYGRIR